jgi:hypothetical protein
MREQEIYSDVRPWFYAALFVIAAFGVAVGLCAWGIVKLVIWMGA